MREFFRTYIVANPPQYIARLCRPTDTCHVRLIQLSDDWASFDVRMQITYPYERIHWVYGGVVDRFSVEPLFLNGSH